MNYRGAMPCRTTFTVSNNGRENSVTVYELNLVPPGAAQANGDDTVQGTNSTQTALNVVLPVEQQSDDQHRNGYYENHNLNNVHRDPVHNNNQELAYYADRNYNQDYHLVPGGVPHMYARYERLRFMADLYPPAGQLQQPNENLINILPPNQNNMGEFGPHNNMDEVGCIQYNMGEVESRNNMDEVGPRNNQLMENHVDPRREVVQPDFNNNTPNLNYNNHPQQFDPNLCYCAFPPANNQNIPAYGPPVDRYPQPFIQHPPFLFNVPPPRIINGHAVNQPRSHFNNPPRPHYPREYSRPPRYHYNPNRRGANRHNNYRGNNYRGNNYRGNNYRGNNYRGNSYRQQAPAVHQRPIVDMGPRDVSYYLYPPQMPDTTYIRTYYQDGQTIFTVIGFIGLDGYFYELPYMTFYDRTNMAPLGNYVVRAALGQQCHNGK